MIATPRLVLRRFAPGDVDKLFAMSREPGLGRWLPDQVYRDLAHASDVLRWLMVPGDPRTGPCVLGIEHEGVLVGHVGLSPARGSVEIGYAVEEYLQGRGLATEAVAAMAAWGLGTLALAEVLGIVDAANQGSRRVLEKAGFVRVADEGARLVYRVTA